MTLSKAEREIVKKKYGGKCAYCEGELKKNWHRDHLLPVGRTQKYVPSHYRHKVTKQKFDQKDLPQGWSRDDYERIASKYVYDKMRYPERDTIENSMPSCHSCNITKSTMSLEEFRKYIENTVESLNKNHYAAYKFAKRYGLVQETIKPVVFYFERFEQNKINL